jgi:hypothetical protein
VAHPSSVGSMAFTRFCLLSPQVSQGTALTDLTDLFNYLWFLMRSLLITLIVEVVRTCGTLVNLYYSTWHYNPQDSHQGTHCLSTGLVIMMAVRKMYFVEMTIRYK